MFERIDPFGCETVFVHTLASSSLGFLRLKTDSGMAGAGHGWFQVEKASRKKIMGGGGFGRYKVPD